MIITRENFDKIVPQKERNLIKSLLDDLDEINLKSNLTDIYIDWQDWHNEYSPEWTDPCPDYYGYYTLRNKVTKEMIGIEMTIKDLDMFLCGLYNYIFNCE